MRLSHCFASLLCAIGLIQCTQASAINHEASLHRRNSTGLTDAVTWDSKSVFIYGQRTFILSAEIHPWRVPNPNLWGDIFQKLKSNGYNTVSFYVNWATHYPTPGTNGGQGDFAAGTYRDIQRFIDEAKAAGLWMIARPGPYVNGETTGGGFPGWVGNVAGTLRTDNVNYTQAWTPYVTAISKLIAKNQITNGGPIILVQAENEFSQSSTHGPYMQAIIDTYRRNGIVIPITHNDQHSGGTGNFSPDLGGTGRVNIYCGDSYPQGSTRWNQVQSIYRTNHLAVAPNNPLCLAEFGGGYLINWGGAAMGGTGYEKFSNDLDNADYENVFYKENYAQTATILNIYMVFGGTNWGNTVEPTVYSSYDYGGGINENRVALPKMNEMRLQGNFLRVARDLLGASYVTNGTTFTSSNLIYTTQLKNANTNAGFYVIRHQDATSTALTTTKLTVSTSSGSLTIPKTGSLTLNGRESKIIVTDFVFGASATNVLYSTAEVMTWTTIDSTDFLVLYAPAGQTGETVFKFPTSQAVTVSGDSSITSSLSGGLLTLGYTLQGAKYVTITASRTINVVLLDKATANNWHAPVIAGSGTFANYFSVGTNRTVLVAGPYVLRSAAIAGDTLNLYGDLNTATTLEFFAPSAVTKLTWNGKARSIGATSHKSFTVNLPGPSSITLPQLTNWKVSGSVPEINPTFDDSSFVTCSQTATNYTNLPTLAGTNVLYSQQYGFYGGHLLFRGHFTATGAEKQFTITVQGGYAFGYSAWFNGVFLGSSQGNSTVSLTTDTWNIPSNSLAVGKDNVLVILQDHMGIVETSTNGGKEPRGIRGYAIVGGNTQFTRWKLQGNLGGAANTPDIYRGYLNEGGLFAERIGAHLPGFPDSNWQSGTPLAGGGVKGAGVNFYRTTFNLNLPADAADVPIRLSITPSAATSNFRVQIYLNGWQLGKYINNIGPQAVFVLPAGITRRTSANTLGLALWSLDGTGASIADIKLISDGAFTSSFSGFGDYTTAPDYAAQASRRTTPQAFPPM